MKNALIVLLLVAGVWAYFNPGQIGPSCQIYVFPASDEDRCAAAIVGEAERGPGHAFALADITDFPWERVFLFGPHTSRTDVESGLGFPWPGHFGSQIERSDAAVLVVFVQGTRIVGWFDLRRTQADLAPCTAEGRKGIERVKARFVVGEGGALSLQATPRGD